MTSETTVESGGEAVDVIVPVLNEREMLPRFVDRMASLDGEYRLIIVDNGSSDGTLEYLRGLPGIRLIEHGEDLGYGRSLVDGMAAAAADTIVIIDADCEYPPEEIPALVGRIRAGERVVYASRFLAGASPQMSATRFWGNRYLTFMFNLLYRQRLTDLYTGMKAMRREAVAGFHFERDGFEHVAELAALLSRRGLVISEVPVRYEPRSTGSSKMRHVPELLKALYCLARYRVVRDA